MNYNVPLLLEIIILRWIVEMHMLRWMNKHTLDDKSQNKNIK